MGRVTPPTGTIFTIPQKIKVSRVQNIYSQNDDDDDDYYYDDDDDDMMMTRKTTTTLMIIK